MNLINKIYSEGITDVDEEEYRNFIEKASKYLEGKTLVKREWNEFLVVGDTHGDIEATKKPTKRAISKDIPIIFLGDYVDRGEKQLENLAYVLALKMDKPNKVILLRGNHETERMNRSYGFYRVVKKIYSSELYRDIVSIYDKLPVAAIIADEYYTAHGGIPKGVKKAAQISDLHPEDESYKEILWNDPSEDVDRFKPNFQRGAYHLYGKIAVEEFLTENNLSKIIRAHEVYQPGYKYFFNEKLLSIFSVSNYRGGNKGKYAHVKGIKIDLIDN